MIGRRGFLSMLGLGAGVAVAASLPVAPPPVPTRAIKFSPLFADGDCIYNGVIIRNVDVAYGKMAAWKRPDGVIEKQRDDMVFYSGEQWKPDQIARLCGAL